MTNETERFTEYMQRNGIVFPYTTTVYMREFIGKVLPINQHVAVIDARYGIDVITPWLI